MGWETLLKKKGGEGTPQLPVLSLTPLSLRLSMDRPTVWEAGRVSTGRCTSPSFVQDSISSFFSELQKLNCNSKGCNSFLLHMSLSTNLNFIPTRTQKSKSKHFSGVCLCLIVEPGQVIRLKIYYEIKSSFTWTEQSLQTYSAGYVQLSEFILELLLGLIQ